MPALRSALFLRDLEPLGALVRALEVDDPNLKASIEKDWQEIRNDVLHGQIDYRGDGPLPEHWRQYIDKEANLFDWRHPKWAKDAERLIIGVTVHAAAREGWNGELKPSAKTTAGLVDLILELAATIPEAAPFADKFLEGMPEWLQHDNAFTGGYLTEDEVARFHDLLAEGREGMARDLKTAGLLPAWIEMLRSAKHLGVGLTWTVPQMRT